MRNGRGGGAPGSCRHAEGRPGSTHAPLTHLTALAGCKSAPPFPPPSSLRPSFFLPLPPSLSHSRAPPSYDRGPLESMCVLSTGWFWSSGTNRACSLPQDTLDQLQGAR